MSAIVAILGTLGAIAASHGLGYLVEKVQEVKSNQNKVQPSQLMEQVRSVVTELRRTGKDLADELDSRLSSIPAIASSGGIQQYIAKITSGLKSASTKVNKARESASDLASQVESQLNAFAYSSDSYKNSKSGRTELARIKNFAETAQGGYHGISEKIDKPL